MENDKQLEEIAEKFAREDAGGSKLDWSSPENLGVTAMQRASFRRGYIQAHKAQQQEIERLKAENEQLKGE